MKIILENMWLLYIIFIGVFVMSMYKSNLLKIGEYNQNYLDKDNTDILKGLSVTIIIVHHLSLFLIEDSVFKILFSKVGFLFVSIFLFVSGYGLIVQFNKKGKDYFKGFLLNKVIRLYLTFFIANIICTTFSNIFFSTNYGFIDMLKSSLLMKFADGRVLWFVAVILYFYIVFYIAYKFFNNKSFIIMVIGFGMWIIGNILLQNGGWFYNSAICFILGILIAKYKDKIYNLVIKKYVMFLTVLTIIFLSLMIVYIYRIDKLQFIIPIVFILLIITLLIKVKLRSNVFKSMNKISFEFYLLQILIMKIIIGNGQPISSLYFILVFLITIILSKILNIIINFMFRRK
jgi:membrane-bound acyltransferase YfiQ involved in biofilm formation